MLFSLWALIGKELAVESDNTEISGFDSLNTYIGGFDLIAKYAIGAACNYLVNFASIEAYDG